MGLRHGDTKEPVAVQVCICPVDARNGGKADQGQIQYLVESRTGAQYRMSLISAVTSCGHMRFMSKEKGGVNAEVFIEFLRLLMIGSKNKIFLIVDRGPAHVAKKTKTFVASLGRRLRLFY